MFKRVVVTGSVAYDYIMAMPGIFSDHIMPDKIHILNVSFIMRKFRREFGGTAGNVAYGLSQFDIPTLLVAFAGSDFEDYNNHLKKRKSIDLSGIKVAKKTKTATGFVMTDRNDNQIWGFYEGAMKHSSKINLKEFLTEEDFLIIAPNDPKATVFYINQAIDLKIPYMFDPAFNIPHLKKNTLMRAIRNAYVLIGNDYEVELMQRRLAISKKKLASQAKILVTTLGPKGSQVTLANKVYKIKAAKPVNSTDPTGAGDAYRAGFVAGLYYDFAPEVCGKMGSLASVYTVEKYGTQTHKFSKESFIKRYNNNFGESLGFDRKLTY